MTLRRLTLTYAPEVTGEVRDVIQRENACCAFLSFEIEEREQETTVTITAPTGKEVEASEVFAMFVAPERKAAACGCCTAGDAQ